MVFLSLRLLAGGFGGATDGGFGPQLDDEFDGCFSSSATDPVGLAFAVGGIFLERFESGGPASRSIVDGRSGTAMPASMSSIFSTIQALYL